MPLTIPIPSIRGGVVLLVVFCKEEIDRLTSCDPANISGEEIARICNNHTGFPPFPGCTPLHGMDFIIGYEEDRDAFIAWLSESPRTSNELIDRLNRGHKNKPGDRPDALDITALMKTVKGPVH